MDPIGSLAGKTALVTGATPGIGHHTAAALARRLEGRGVTHPMSLS